MLDPQSINRSDDYREAAPPYNIEAEQGFLGALLIWNSVLDDAEFLAPDHFFDPFHARIFALCREQIRQGRAATPITLQDNFVGDEPIGDVPPAVYLARLAVGACIKGNARHYARTIVDLAVRRWLILAGEDLAQSAREASTEVSPLALIEEAEGRLYAHAQAYTGEAGGTTTLAEATARAISAAASAYKGDKKGINTGLIDLDTKLGGLQATDLIVLAGRPSMGKTALALNVAVYVARRNVPVVFFSLEMSDEQLALRAFSDVIGVPSEKMRSGRLTQEQIDGAVKSADVFADVPLFIDQAGGISIAQLTSKARRLKRKHGIGLIVVDYLQLMQASKSRGNRVQDITEITVGLKALAKELRVPVLALSQLSRSVEQRENKRPQLADLRESGSIEQDADIVLFVYREEYYLERAQPTDCDAIDEWQEKLRACSGKAEIIIGKQRHGPLGIIPVAFDGQLTRFSNLAREAGYDRS